MIAASTGSSKICSLLLESGANVDAFDRNGNFIIDRLMIKGKPRRLGMSIVHHAIDSKNFETVAVIVRQLEKDKEFEMNRPVGLHQWTPLYRAVMHDCNKEIIELLLHHGADLQCEDRSTGTTALQLAVIRGNLVTVQLLITHGADPTILSKVRSFSLSLVESSSRRFRTEERHFDNWPCQRTRQ